jgi:zinc transporter ZupT
LVTARKTIVERFFARLLARVRRRIAYALITAVMTGTLAVLSAWLGLPTRFNPLNYPHPLSEIWWYFPAYGVIGFVLIVLLPRRFDKDLGV